jgi:hypothetical protein
VVYISDERELEEEKEEEARSVVVMSKEEEGKVASSFTRLSE